MERAQLVGPIQNWMAFGVALWGLPCGIAFTLLTPAVVRWAGAPDLINDGLHGHPGIGWWNWAAISILVWGAGGTVFGVLLREWARRGYGFRPQGWQTRVFRLIRES